MVGQREPAQKIYFEDKNGKRRQDIWTEFKDPQNPLYPTAKNLDMIDTIVKTSSNPGSIVLDCFCGSGTTLEAALRNGRRFIGIDKSEVAIKATKERLAKADGGGLLESAYDFSTWKMNRVIRCGSSRCES